MCFYNPTFNVLVLITVCPPHIFNLVPSPTALWPLVSAEEAGALAINEFIKIAVGKLIYKGMAGERPVHLLWGTPTH